LLTLQNSAGSVLVMRAFHVRATYEGLYAGLPDRYRNAEMIEAAAEIGRDEFPGQPVHVIEPDPIVYQPAPRPAGGREYGWLPRLVCAGEFSSGPVNPDEYESYLVMVWFQDDVPPIIAPSVEEKIRAGPLEGSRKGLHTLNLTTR
jgi:hypothetical protein